MGRAPVRRRSLTAFADFADACVRFIRPSRDVAFVCRKSSSGSFRRPTAPSAKHREGDLRERSEPAKRRGEQFAEGEAAGPRPPNTQASPRSGGASSSPKAKLRAERAREAAGGAVRRRRSCGGPRPPNTQASPRSGGEPRPPNTQASPRSGGASISPKAKLRAERAREAAGGAVRRRRSCGGPRPPICY
jgi:hypothetical protein